MPLSPSHSTVATRSTSGAGARPHNPSNPDWRCAGCGKLLGVRRDGQMQIRFARGHQYLASFPVTATCRSCGTLNHAVSPAT